MSDPRSSEGTPSGNPHWSAPRTRLPVVRAPVVHAPQPTSPQPTSPQAALWGWSPTRWRQMSVLVSAAAVGCGYNCQDTCQHVYAQSECNVATGQLEETDKIDSCIETCQDALTKTGELDGYDPFEAYVLGDPPSLENEKQAAYWMECVWLNAPEPGYQAGCANLETTEGFCAPI